MTKRKPPRTAWKPGVSGNPAGRKPGTGKVAALRAQIEDALPELLVQLIERAQSGDAQCARLLVDKVLPGVRATEQPAPIELPEGGDLTAKGAAVLQAVAAGELAPTTGAQLLGAIAGLARVAELDDVVRRLAALEAAAGKQGEQP